MYYKLTDWYMQTYMGCTWKLDEWKIIDEVKRGKGLCSNSWFHCFDDPLLAIFMNGTCAGVTDPRLFECEVRGDTFTDYGVKHGFSEMRIVAELDMKKITNAQRIVFGILCAKQGCDDATWNQWADNWLRGIVRYDLFEPTCILRDLSGLVPGDEAARLAVWSGCYAKDDAFLVERWSGGAAKYIALMGVDLKPIANEAMYY